METFSRYYNKGVAMSDDRVLESIGKLSGLVEASREDIKGLVVKNDKQSECIQEITTSVKLLETSMVATVKDNKSDFKDVNEKLSRDYTAINDLKTKTIVANGIDNYKLGKRNWWRWALGIIGGCIGILIGVNQLVGIVHKAQSMPVKINPPIHYDAVPIDTTNIFGFEDSTRGR